ncbi:hypothetical protein GCM10007857_85800 [Bradyrhizobium iriomotense]|uniref:Uncharacterized protein n=1 Tax=Bradyrhizobium iriomotense TaxID=441950 RepID=A0ABQ6BI02_9BRAD|nr:hypothetical protein GCM10007857_85800 [Bradyrhizobium iriomotense]
MTPPLSGRRSPFRLSVSPWYKIASGLAGEQPNEVDKTGIGLRRDGYNRDLGRRLGDHAELLGCCSLDRAIAASLPLRGSLRDKNGKLLMKQVENASYINVMCRNWAVIREAERIRAGLR